MTAAPERRRRATRLALVATALVLVMIVGAGVVGARALYRSTDGRDASGPDRETVPMPDTPNALLGVTSADGRLASLAVLTSRPRSADGTAEPGGSIVPLPVIASIDGNGGPGPLVERYDGDTAALGRMVGSVLGVTFDQTVVVDEARMAELLEPVSQAPVDLPADVVAVDGVEPTVLFEAGEQEITGTEAAAILAAAPPGEGGAGDATAVRNAAAVWSAVAAERTTAVADDSSSESSSTAPVTSSEPPAPDSSSPGSPAADGEGVTLDAFMGTLLAGPVEARELHATPVTSADRPLVELGRLDALLVFGQLSPRKVVEASPSYSVRVVSPFAGEDLAEGTSADAAYAAIELLVEEEVNVVSVSTTPGDVPATTRIDVVNPDAADFAEVLGADLFGDHALEESSKDLAGVDLVVTLGESFVA